MLLDIKETGEPRAYRLIGDSSGIRALLRAMNRLDGSGKLVLLSPIASVRHIFSLMGVATAVPS